MASVFESQGSFGRQVVIAVKLAVFGNSDQAVGSPGESKGSFMLLAGADISEQIISMFLFLMNTREEVQ